MVQNVGYEGILRERAVRSECLNDFVQFCIQAYLKGRSVSKVFYIYCV